MDEKVLEKLLRDTVEKLRTEKRQETSAYNILSAIGEEYDEAHIHSKIIFFLLDGTYSNEEENVFLKLLLQTIHVPQKASGSHWKVYREKVFEYGRIDFVIESKELCIAIEMKIGASDGNRQLERYEGFCRKKGKEYLLYYLTLNRHEPDEKSAGNMNRDRLRLISFEKEIIAWLESCMETVDRDSYKYSFLKQYLATVRHITGADEEMTEVKDLLTSAEMAKAALVIQDSFKKKMEEVTETFFEKTGCVLRRETGRFLHKDARVEVDVYSDALEIYIADIQYRGKTYHFAFDLAIDWYLYACFGFADEESGFILLSEAKKLFPAFYHEGMGRVEELDLSGMRRSKRTLWYYIENTRGEKFDFHKHSDSVLELIDEMDEQSRVIGEAISTQVLKPLLKKRTTEAAR